MKTRSVVLAALGAVFVLGAATPASADYDDWRNREWREHEWREQHHHHHWRQEYYAPPRVYYAPPRVYYAPRTDYYEPRY